ncbi:MAG: hypothetical protein PF501_10145 [Salinisphaera sp.]|jgi:hypothetical protein|nr:hypothetical protein [Salinisphaera sp.]
MITTSSPVVRSVWVKAIRVGTPAATSSYYYDDDEVRRRAEFSEKSGIHEILTPESGCVGVQVLALGADAQAVLTRFARDYREADFRFVDPPNHPNVWPDLVIAIGHASELAAISALGPFGPATVAVVLDAADADRLTALRPTLSSYITLFPGADSHGEGNDFKAADNALEILLSSTIRHGMIGTDFADIRRVLDIEGIAHCHVVHGACLKDIQDVINDATGIYSADWRAQGVLALLIGSAYIGIDDFQHLNERLTATHAFDNAGVLVTLKERAVEDSAGFTVGIVTIRTIAYATTSDTE